MHNVNRDDIFRLWNDWFSGTEHELLQKNFHLWEKLEERSRKIESILNRMPLLSNTKEAHQKAALKLDFSNPYRIVVLGESGAGKSSTINALLGQNNLVTGAGGAITGVPVYVFPISSDESEHIRIIYRTDEEFTALVRNLSGRHQIELPSDLIEMIADIEKKMNSALEDENSKRRQVLSDLHDIVITWRRIKEQGILGEIQRMDIQQNDNVRQLMEERSELNSAGSNNRIIAGIKRIEYYLQNNYESGYAESLPGNIVFIDTPGIGARTVRHEEVLLEEIESADAVILVVNARRPEEKTASMAYLLNESLLSGLTREQKNHFSQKVFLVVNQMDAIRDTSDKKRLDNSVKEICSIIAPGFWERYVVQSNETRYFETIAEMAIYGQALLEDKKLDADSQKRLRAYMESLLLEIEDVNTEPHIAALNKSQIPLLRSKLSEFLSDRRLQIILDEAKLLLDRIANVAKEEIDSYFKQNDMDSRDLLKPDVTYDRSVRQLCLQQLKKDKRELDGNYGQMWQDMQNWRRSGRYRESLKSQLEKICKDIDGKIRLWLDNTLANPENFTTIQVGPVGKEFIQMHELKFLNDAERHLRQLMEAHGNMIANYYFDEFNKFLEDHRIYENLKEKSYYQEYIFSIEKYSSFEQYQTVIDREFKDICRWISVYELMRNPLLSIRSDTGEMTTKIADDVAKHLFDIALESFELSVKSQVPVSGLLFGKLKGKMGWSKNNKTTNISENQAAKVDTQASKAIQGQENQMDKCLRKLRSSINEALNRNDINTIKLLVGKEVSARSKEALGKSLPYLDMLFFYQLEKHQKYYEQVVEVVNREHTQQVLDRNETIRQLIVRKNDSFFSKAMEMLESYNAIRSI